LLFRKFASATRNYAQRQLKWYRSDSLFLWLQIHRQKDISLQSQDLEPYKKIVDEIVTSSPTWQRQMLQRVRKLR
jgi:tRNA A37 N6-isopentenylltransferase MiaA